MCRCFTEAKAGIQHDTLGLNACAHYGVTSLLQKMTYINDHIIVVNLLLHGPGLTLHVHDAQTAIGVLDGLEGTGHAQGIDVIDHVCTGRQAGAHDLRLERIHRQGHTAVAQALDQRDDTLKLLFQGNGFGTGTSRLATNIQNVCAFGD